MARFVFRFVFGSFFHRDVFSITSPLRFSKKVFFFIFRPLKPAKMTPLGQHCSSSNAAHCARRSCTNRRATPRAKMCPSQGKWKATILAHTSQANSHRTTDREVCSSSIDPKQKNRGPQQGIRSHGRVAGKRHGATRVRISGFFAYTAEIWTHAASVTGAPRVPLPGLFTGAGGRRRGRRHSGRGRLQRGRHPIPSAIAGSSRRRAPEWWRRRLQAGRAETPAD